MKSTLRGAVAKRALPPARKAAMRAVVTQRVAARQVTLSVLAAQPSPVVEEKLDELGKRAQKAKGAAFLSRYRTITEA